MALIIDLKPGEKVLVGEAVITNDQQRTRLHIAGSAPILREKDVLKEEDVRTPCEHVYFIVQCMYIANDPKQYHDRFFALEREVQTAAPSMSFFFSNINTHIIDSSYYKALKEAKEMLKYEQELLNNAKTTAAE